MAGNGEESGNGSTAAAVKARASVLVMTNVVKITGLVAFVNEAIVRSDARLPVLGICMLCIAGGQVTETVILSIIDRFLGRPSP